MRHLHGRKLRVEADSRIYGTPLQKITLLSTLPDAIQEKKKLDARWATEIPRYLYRLFITSNENQKNKINRNDRATLNVENFKWAINLYGVLVPFRVRFTRVSSNLRWKYFRGCKIWDTVSQSGSSSSVNKFLHFIIRDSREQRGVCKAVHTWSTVKSK